MLWIAVCQQLIDGIAHELARRWYVYAIGLK